MIIVFPFFPRLSEIEDKLDNLKNMEASVINKNKVEKDLQEQNQVNFSKDIRQVFIFIIFRTSSQILTEGWKRRPSAIKENPVLLFHY